MASVTEKCECCGTVLATPLVSEAGRVPWKTRWVYLQRVLRGKIRPVGPVDITHLEDEGWMEGRVRIQVWGP